MKSIEMCERLGHQVILDYDWASWYCMECNEWRGGSTWNIERPEKPCC